MGYRRDILIGERAGEEAREYISRPEPNLRGRRQSDYPSQQYMKFMKNITYSI